MDYVVGSIAALISGNVTPNRPKLIRRALTPTKHQSSPNVTPKSEAVADRSIFLSPSVQKKKEIVKKSPKRIFENPDLDVTENSDSLSPKADKVKKHLEGELEADAMGKSSIISKKSPSSKLDKSLELVAPNKKSKINDSQAANENTPKKKKKKSELEVTETSKSEEMEVDQPPLEVGNQDRKSPKKMKKLNPNDVDNQTEVIKAADESNLTIKDTVNAQGKKKNKKRKKNKGAIKVESNIVINTNSDSQNKATDENNSTEAKSPKKKKNRKNKNKKEKSTKEVEQNESPHANIEESDDETNEITNTNSDSQNKATDESNSTEAKSSKKKKNRKNKNKKEKSTKEFEQNEPPHANIEESGDETKEITNKVSDDKTEAVTRGNEESDDETGEIMNEVDGNESNDEDDQESESDEEVSNIANPNAITEKDSDSEHDSDDEIESENEESNLDLKTEEADDSSDDESQAKNKKSIKKKKDAKQNKENNKEVKEDGPEKEVNTEEEIKRTLFVGNVPFSNKCKKEIKKIFSQYGEIETVRIRTVPVKDARVTPKLAIIKNEIHPDRSTVNVYVKFADPESVELALAENNTVLNHHHLRVSRSAATGVEHDPHCAVFLGNLPFGIEDETLREKFEKCGDIHSVRIVRDKKTNAGKGFGYVNFASRDGVELALGLSEEDLTIKNRIIRVKRCTQTLKGPKKVNKFVKHVPRKDGQNQGQNSGFGNNQAQRGNSQGPNRGYGNNQRNFGNNQGQNRNFGNNQGQNRNFGNNQGQNRNFGNNQGQNRNFGNNQGPSRNFGNNQGQNRNFGNNQGPSRNFGNNQGQNRNFGNNQGPRNFGNKFGNQDDAGGASRRIMNKRPHQENGDGPPNKKQHLTQSREKKQRKEFVGLTAEKKKKQKFDKGQKKKKAISEIMTKKT